uniref:Uncharacterized protein n=1 Tax=Naja naja TaxID=35670 RepID=A0A8C6XFK2_NAJNA
RRRCLVKQQRHGAGLLRLGDQHGVAAEQHRLVLHLVAVDPGEEARKARVRHAVGDAVQQVEVARAGRSLGRHGRRQADALRPDAPSEEPPPRALLERAATGRPAAEPHSGRLLPAPLRVCRLPAAGPSPSTGQASPAWAIS